jgi:hypothetical protein
MTFFFALASYVPIQQEESESNYGFNKNEIGEKKIQKT